MVTVSIRPMVPVPEPLLSGWVNQALPAWSTATSAGSVTGTLLNCPVEIRYRQTASLLKSVIQMSSPAMARSPPRALVFGMGTGVRKVAVAMSKRNRTGSFDVR